MLRVLACRDIANIRARDYAVLSISIKAICGISPFSFPKRFVLVPCFILSLRDLDVGLTENLVSAFQVLLSIGLVKIRIIHCDRIDD